MKDKFTKIILISIAISLWIIVLQNFGIIDPIKRNYVYIGNTLDVSGNVDVSGTVDIGNTVDINLSEVVGYPLVTSKRGMFIGVNSTENTVIPIHWGSISNY